MHTKVHAIPDTDACKHPHKHRCIEKSRRIIILASKPDVDAYKSPYTITDTDAQKHRCTVSDTDAYKSPYTITDTDA